MLNDPDTRSACTLFRVVRIAAFTAVLFFTQPVAAFADGATIGAALGGGVGAAVGIGIGALTHHWEQAWP
jgi:hypothetical protein